MLGREINSRSLCLSVRDRSPTFLAPSRHRLTVRTCGSHPHNRGSIPRGDAILSDNRSGF